MKTVPAIGPTDHSDWVGRHRLSNKKTYTERADCSPTYMLLSEIVNKFVIPAILAAMISSAETKKFISKNYLNICCRNSWENCIIYVFFKKVPSKIKSVGKL